MKNLVAFHTQFITRSILQTLFHRALIAGEYVPCAGLLGVSAQDESCVQSIQMVQSEADLAGILASWDTEQVRCMGCFQLENQTISDAILQTMPEQYIALAVRLDAVGRLDVLANVCDKNTKDAKPLTLNLIEDGHAVVDE